MIVRRGSIFDSTSRFEFEDEDEDECDSEPWAASGLNKKQGKGVPRILLGHAFPELT